MLPIDLQLEDRMFRYTQVMRDGGIAIYEQQHKENLKVVRYEVVRIRVQAERLWPNGVLTPEREAYPGASSWGRDEFTCFTLAECGR